jgi:alpha-ketoglutarate-dependent taurine dioxygenase
MVSPAVADFNPIEWAATEREFIETNLLKYGAILFRGFNLDGPEEFERFASAICSELFADYGDLPREQVGVKVYGSTPYPNDQAILFHNESSHMHCWPLKIWFYCLTPPRQGGETPVVDCRDLYRQMDPAMRKKFCDKGLMYVRNFSADLDVRWQDFFRASDPTAVEEFCRGAGILCEWREENTLRTKRICPAVVVHPRTGQNVFFNQLQAHHISCLESTVRGGLLNLFGEEGLPRNVYYGDGERIPDSVVTELKDLYEKHAKSFTWQQGDLLMVDNMLVAHGRRPFVGPRKIVVAMGEMVNSTAGPELS